MYVYFVRARGKPQRLKIGKASDPERRLKELQTGCPYPLQLEAKLKCRNERHAFQVERAAHEYFAAERTIGEWFKCTDYVLTRLWQFSDVLEYPKR